MRKSSLQVVNNLYFETGIKAFFLAYCIIGIRHKHSNSLARLREDVLRVFRRKYKTDLPLVTVIQLMSRQIESKDGVIGHAPGAPRKFQHQYLVVRDRNVSQFMERLVSFLIEEDEDNDVFRLIGVEE